MAAHFISEVEPRDPAAMETYRTLAAASIERFGGRYVVRGAPVELVEGARDEARRFVIVEFPDMERARAWYRSPDYAAALAVRDRALTRTLVFVEGVGA